MNVALTFLYENGLWLRNTAAAKLARWFFAFLAHYAILADRAVQCGKRRFPVYPKSHMLAHAALKLQRLSQTCRWVLSPLATACQQEEDYIGKPSRLSRSVNVRQAHRSILWRSLIKIQDSLRQAQADERGMDSYRVRWPLMVWQCLQMKDMMLKHVLTLSFVNISCFLWASWVTAGGRFVAAGRLDVCNMRKEWVSWNWSFSSKSQKAVFFTAGRILNVACGQSSLYILSFKRGIKPVQGIYIYIYICIMNMQGIKMYRNVQNIYIFIYIYINDVSVVLGQIMKSIWAPRPGRTPQSTGPSCSWNCWPLKRTGELMWTEHFLFHFVSELQKNMVISGLTYDFYPLMFLSG